MFSTWTIHGTVGGLVKVILLILGILYVLSPFFVASPTQLPTEKKVRIWFVLDIIVGLVLPILLLPIRIVTEEQSQQIFSEHLYVRTVTEERQIFDASDYLFIFIAILIVVIVLHVYNGRRLLGGFLFIGTILGSLVALYLGIFSGIG